MLKIAFILFGVLLITNAAEFPTLSLVRGKAVVQVPRSLEGPKQGIQNYSLNSNLTVNSAVQVNLGDAFRTVNNIPQTRTTSMLIFLYTNVSGFCSDCTEFFEYKCDKQYCKSVYKTSFNMSSPYYSVKSSYTVKHDIFLGDDVTKSAWRLTTPAILFSYDKRVSRSVSTGFPYITDKDAFGFIGLGASGDASKNFNTGESQIFSVKINATGEGSLIFGKNQSLYNDTIPPQIIATDANWTSKAVSMNLGTEEATNFKASVIFDLQHPGIAIPLDAFNAVGGVWKKFVEKYSIVVDRSVPDDGYVYVYNGNIDDLRPFTMILDNGGKITVPASAYTEKIADSKYKILITAVEKTENFTKAKTFDDFIVLGRSVLSQYYTVFERNVKDEPSITLYTPVKGTPIIPDPPKGHDYSVYIIVGALIVALLMAALGAAFLKPEKQHLKADMEYKTLGDSATAYERSVSPTLISGSQL